MRKSLGMREPVNTLTHFVPFLAAIIALVILIAQTKNSTGKLITMTIYGVSVIMLFGASSLYHWLRTEPRIQALLRKIDHVAIYILIGGSYTPVFYYGLEGTWKWAMLTAVWTFVILGLLLKIWFMGVPRYVSTAFYVCLGWIALVPFFQLIHNLPVGAIVFMLSGGICYTVGALIYATKTFDFFPLKFGFHEIFHLFIAMGGILHYVMMFIYFIPR